MNLYKTINTWYCLKMSNQLAAFLVCLACLILGNMSVDIKIFSMARNMLVSLFFIRQRNKISLKAGKWVRGVPYKNQ